VSNQDTLGAQRELIERLSSLEAARSEAERTAEATRQERRKDAASAAVAEQEHAKELMVQAKGLREMAAALARLPQGEYEPSYIDGRPLDQLGPAVTYLRRALPAQQNAIDALNVLRAAMGRAFAVPCLLRFSERERRCRPEPQTCRPKQLHLYRLGRRSKLQ
jgi:hypothetical protein